MRDARADDNDALRWACGNGHLATAQWLASHFGLTPADARAGDGAALRKARRNGHLATERWLAGYFGLTAAAGHPAVAAPRAFLGRN